MAVTIEACFFIDKLILREGEYGFFSKDIET